MGISYKDAGVDIDKGNEAVQLMKEHVKSTFNDGVLTDIGGFGGLFRPDLTGMEEPVLVSGTDGVGTKLKLAMLMDRHDTIGIDAVAMCVNDILVQGAAPLFFLDYLACGKLEPEKIAAIVSGVAEGCRQSGAALIGGETAEMPDFYGEDEYDIAGFAVGIVDKQKIIDGKKTASGDVMLALPSTGVHSNGFSLVRKLVFDVAKLKVDDYVEELGCTIGEELLRPTKIYVSEILPLLKKYEIKAMSHITGGGLIENIPRCINPWLNAVIDVAWPVPPIFSYLQKIGKVSPLEMHRVFNMGFGFIVICDEENADRIEEENPRFMRVGYLEPGEGKTEIMGVNV
ncbi:MAG: phosphoribosylformylglycinamidine cyclo-ligase [Bacillota bacterium]|jgi:phosphoribosylformylglycinamidine cyclo-ligase